MRILKNALVLLFGAVLLASCVPKDIEIELPKHQPKLSIFSQVIPNRVLLVAVTKTFNSLEPQDSLKGDSAFISQLLVSDAIVTVSFGGRTETLQNISPGIYVSINTLQITGEQYTLYVKDPATGLECSATSSMLPKMNFSSVIPKTEISNGDTSVSVEYSLTDMPGKDNFYLVSYTPFKRENSPAANNPFLSIRPTQNTFQLLTDKLFEDGQYKGTLNVNAMPGDTIAVSLVNISEEYYKYLVVYQKSGKVFNQITGEPIDFPTNVINGYGFFTTHNPDVRQVEL